MVFAKLADIIVRRYKTVLFLWIVALLYIAPAITRANEVLVYQESEMVEGDSESLVAQSIIEEQFPVSLANSTLMIVVTGPDVGSPEARDFSLAVESRATAVGGLSYVQDFTSVYSASRMMIYQLASELGPAMVQTEYQVNMTASLMYGIPALYVNNWVATNSTYPVEMRDNISYQMTIAAMPYLLAGADPSTAQISYLYLSGFCSAWNLTSGSPALTSDPPARAETAIGVAAPQLIEGLPYPSEQ